MDESNSKKGHKAKAKDKRKYKCFICQKRFLKSSLKAHSETHKPMEERKRFKCETCGRKFLSKSGLYGHYNFRHGNAKYKRPHLCGLCDKAFKSVRDLSWHVRTHTNEGVVKYHCKLCGNQVTQKKSHDNHIMDKHNKNVVVVLNRSAQEIGNKPQRKSNFDICHPCTICKKKFDQKTNLENHIQTVHSQHRPFKCDFCGKGYVNKYQKSSHEQTVHHLSALKAFPCGICKKSFSRLIYLNDHIRTHTGERPFKCSAIGCEKSFKQLGHRAEHEAVFHGGNVNWPCPEPECGKVLRSKKSRNAHVREIHLKEKRIKCPICPKTFFRVAACTIHMRGHTGEKPSMCSHCPKTCATMAGITNHKNKVHNFLKFK